MAYPNASYGDILSTTIQLLQDDIVDQISNNNALLFELKGRDQIKPFDGGPKIVQPLEYAENGTYQRYQGYETLDITPSQVFTAAEYNIKQIAISVSMSGLEMIQNSGKSQMKDLMEARLKNARHTLDNNFETDLWSDGTGSGGKQVGGMQLLIPDDPTTGTVGGISRASYSWWQPYHYHGAADGGAAVSSVNISTYMKRVLNGVFVGKERPTVIMADGTYYTYYWESLAAIQRFQSDQKNNMASGGFDSVLFESIPVVNCGGLGGACPAAHMYFINGKYLYLRPFKGRQFTELNPTRHSVNQDAEVRLIAWAGNLTLSNGRKQGLLVA